MDVMNPIVETAIVGLTTKFIDLMVDKVKDMSKDALDRFKVDFRVSFQEYLKRSYNKYSKIKTILYRNEPQYIYDFFEVPYLSKKEESEFKTYEEDGFKVDNISDILSISEFVIIKGTGGIGKSTLMKHLFINTLEQGQDIPVFLELKDLNSVENSIDMEEIILSRIRDLGCDLEKKYLLYALDGVRFLFLLDGYDELSAEKKDWFFKEINAFCDRYPKNHYIISSRECSEFIEFQRFSVLRALPLNKEQALSLISKLRFDEKIKREFVDKLRNGLYEKHKSFASNPLLLNIMLLTYDNYAEIPGKMHVFYSNAFETLYSKHDATKGGYRREFKSGLSMGNFKKSLSLFSYLTYAGGELEFSYNQLQNHLERVIEVLGYSFSIEDYIEDLINGVCVLYKDGFNYRFTHRSFQEYFTAVFLSSLTDENMEKMGRNLIKKDTKRAANDSMFDMLYDMNEHRFEKNILLPIVNEFENGLTGDRYDFYFREFSKEFHFFNDTFSIRMEPRSYFPFIRMCCKHYFKEDEKRQNRQDIDRNMSLDIFWHVNQGQYDWDCTIDTGDIMKDSLLYSYIKETHEGVEVSVLSDLKNRIEENLRKRDDYLDSFLDD